jgi:hypothetical protein
MLRFACAALCLGLVLGLTARADDKKEVTLEGKITCAKCDLKVADSCHTVIVVKDGDKEVTYYFDKAKDKYHKEVCRAAKEGKVTGTVSEKDGKKVIKVSKVEFK